MFGKVKRILNPFVPKYERMYVFEKKVDTFFIKDLPSNFSLVRATTLSEIDSLISQRPYWYKEWAQKRFKQGNMCFGVKDQNKIVSCIWTCFNEVELPNVEYHLKVSKDVVPVLGGWTSHSYRSIGLYTYVMNSCLKYFSKESSYSSAYFFILPDNINSLQIHKDFTVVKMIRLIKIFPFKFRKIENLNCKIDELINLRPKNRNRD